MTNYEAWLEEFSLDHHGFFRKWRFAWDGATSTWKWDQRNRVALLDKVSRPAFAVA
jgi:hypothetical protein